MDNSWGFVILIVLAVACVYVYFLPTIVASKRGHRNRVAISVLNVLLGWTFVGWVAALVWANTSDVEEQQRPSLDVADRPEPSWMRDKGLAPPHAATPAPQQPRQAAVAAEKACPFCAETIKAAAIVCKHCGRDLPAPAPDVVATSALDAEAEALGVIWSPVAERYMWRREFFKDLGEAVEYARRNA